MNPLNTKHHLKTEDVCQYREGVTTQKKTKDDAGTYVYIGLHREVLIDKSIQPGVRVTVKLNEEQKNKKKLHGIAVRTYILF